MNPVIRPDSANSPKCDAHCPSGAICAISVRDAACAGPMKMPSAIASTQNQVTLSVSSSAAPSTIMLTSAIITTRFAPRRSSISPNPAAPSPAVTFSAMPNSRICSIPMPCTPAA